MAPSAFLLQSSADSLSAPAPAANDTEYGLAAAVFSNDARQTHRVSGALQAGTVWINRQFLRCLLIIAPALD